MNFLDKFNDQIEIIGKDGVEGMMRALKAPVESTRIIHHQINYIKLKTPNFINSLKAKRPPLKKLEKSNSALSLKALKVNNKFLKENKKLLNQIEKKRLSQSVDVIKPANNIQNIIDHGYTPYTIEDYRKLPKQIKLGKLGPNIGTSEWNKKYKLRNKMKDYSWEIVSTGKGVFFNKNYLLPEAQRKKEKQEMISKSHRTKIFKYVQELENRKKIENEIFKNKYEEILSERKRRDDIKKENQYLTRLEKIKKLLFNY